MKMKGGKNHKLMCMCPFCVQGSKIRGMFKKILAVVKSGLFGRKWR